MELVMVQKAAHEGQKIYCLAAGKDGYLYSGGDDNVGRLAQGSVVKVTATQLYVPVLERMLGSATRPPWIPLKTVQPASLHCRWCADRGFLTKSGRCARLAAHEG